MRRSMLVLLLLLAPAPALATGGQGTINYIREHNGDCDLAWHGDPSHTCAPYPPPGALYEPRAERRERQ